MADSACPKHVDAMTDGMHPVFVVTPAECDICTVDRLCADDERKV